MKHPIEKYPIGYALLVVAAVATIGPGSGGGASRLLPNDTVDRRYRCRRVGPVPGGWHGSDGLVQHYRKQRR